MVAQTEANVLGGMRRLNGQIKVERSGQTERLWESRDSKWTAMVRRCYLRRRFSSLTRSHQQLHHCYFDSVSSWTAGSPSSQSSWRMWAGVWHWESAGHSCSLSTKTSMWHLRVLPDERRGHHRLEQPCLFRCVHGVPALKEDTSAWAAEAPSIFSFPPLVFSCLSSAANFHHTFSSE